MKHTSLLLALLLSLVSITQLAAQTQSQKDLAKAKKNITKLGAGTNAKTKITLNDGTIVKGYVYTTDDDEFVIRDSKTDSPTTIRYADVKVVEDNRRNAKVGDLLMGIGAAAVGATIFAVVATGGRGLR